MYDTVFTAGFLSLQDVSGGFLQEFFRFGYMLFRCERSCWISFFLLEIWSAQRPVGVRNNSGRLLKWHRSSNSFISFYNDEFYYLFKDANHVKIRQFTENELHMALLKVDCDWLTAMLEVKNMRCLLYFEGGRDDTFSSERDLDDQSITDHLHLCIYQTLLSKATYSYTYSGYTFFVSMWQNACWVNTHLCWVCVGLCWVCMCWVVYVCVGLNV